MKLQSMVSAQWWMLALLAGCASPKPSASAPQQMRVDARNFAFEAPDTVPSGPTTIWLVNNGPAFHHAWLVRLEGGRAVSDLQAHFAAGAKEFPDWATHVGGPNASNPGDSTEATVDLAAGNYALLCVIPEKGVPHFALGMMRSVTVVPASASVAMPPADLKLTLDDYSFTEDRPLTAGRHVIAVENVAEQPHELVIVRLNEGRTGQDVLQWLEHESGPPPGSLMGGVSGLSKGRSNQIALNLTPGKYFLICFVPDRADGKSHFMHGMVREFEVRES